MITTILNLSISLDATLTKSCIIDICKFIELSKAIQIAYYEKTEFITLGKQFILQIINRRLLSFIQAAKV
jgi:hypothetical protein